MRDNIFLINHKKIVQIHLLKEFTMFIPLAHPSHSKCQSSIISTQINLVIICKFKSMHSIFGCIYQHGYDNQSYLLTFAISHSSVVVMSYLVKEQCMLW